MVAKISSRTKLKNQRIWNRSDKLGYINSYVDSYDKQMLEIGPSIAPIWSIKDYTNLRYLETVGAKGLEERAKQRGKGSPIEHVHYIFDNSIGFEGSIENTKEYSYVSSSHVIEHIPDFVDHLKSIGNICTEGGYYFAVVPDKNLIFDKARPNSSLGDIISHHFENKSALSAAIDSIYYAVQDNKSNGRGWWNSNDNPELVCRSKLSSVKNSDVESLIKNGFEKWTGHYHVFDPLSFAELIHGLQSFDLIDLSLCDVVSTGHMDFIAIFKNDSGKSNLSLEDITKSLNRQNYPFLGNRDTNFTNIRGV